MSTSSEAEQPDPTKICEANYVLGVLFFVIMLNFLDRQIISILAEPIKQYMGLSDQQLGMVAIAGTSGA